MEPFAIIGSALISYLGTAGTIPFYQDLAPGSVKPPYGIISWQSSTEEYTWDSEEIQSRYQIKIVSNREWPGEATLLYGQAHSLVQDAPLAMSGGVSLLRCRRDNLVRYQDPKRFWHVGGLYRIDIIGEG